jgi:carbonic anhydrase/acetyltransferase-like protein (isoleucine patch superfamily)
MPIRAFNDILPRIHASAYIDPQAVVIGDVQIGEQASLWPYVVARGDVNRIDIGARTNIQDATVLHVAHAGKYNPTGNALIIGDDVTVGHKACLHACSIEHHCLIGIGAIVLDGAEIGAYSLIAAGALVTPGKKLPGGYLWRGNPAKQARQLTDSEKEQLDYSAQNYVKLAGMYAKA